MDKVRIGIIGCGGIAKLKHFPALKKLNNRAEIVGCCDLVDERAAEAASVYGATGAKTYTDYRRLLEDKTIDAVYVLTPNVAHAPITVDALEAGKHVLCEKPMAATSADARKMLDATKRTGKKLTIGYQNRFRRDMQLLYKMCRGGDLGEIYYSKAHAVRRKGVPTWGVFPDKSKQGGGPLIDIGTHALDITLWATNNYRPKLVVGSVFQKMKDNPEGNMFGEWDPKTYEVEDSAFGFIKMEDGATIYLEATWALNIGRDQEGLVVMCGTKAGLETVGEGAGAPTAPVNGPGRVISHSIQHGQMVDTAPMVRTGPGPADFGGDVFRVGDAESTAWIDAIVNNTEPYVKPEEAFMVTRILEAIYQSAEMGKAIEFSDDQAAGAS